MHVVDSVNRFSRPNRTPDPVRGSNRWIVTRRQRPDPHHSGLDIPDSAHIDRTRACLYGVLCRRGFHSPSCINVIPPGHTLDSSHSDLSQAQQHSSDFLRTLSDRILRRLPRPWVVAVTTSAADGVVAALVATAAAVAAGRFLVS